MGFLLFGVVVIAAPMGACGSDDSSNAFNGSDGGDGDATMGDGAITFGGGDGQAQALTIDPMNPVLDVNGPKPTTTQQLKASLNGQPTSATWTIDVASIGTIDATGLFKPTGTMGGVTRVQAQVGNLKAQTTLTVRLHYSENPGNVDPGTQGKLGMGGSGDPSFKWLYPYDKTVFPRGLLPPTLMFASTADAYLVHATSKSLDYKGYFAGTGAKIDWAPAIWTMLTQTAGGAGDPVKVEVTKIAGGVVAGPIAESWVIAPGSLKGTVYYNSYTSQLAGGGAVLRIKPGAAQPDVLAGGADTKCRVCHAVSADGSTLITSRDDYQSGDLYDLKNPGAVPRVQPDSKFTFGGVYPNGSLVMTNAALSGGWPPNVPGQEQGPRASMLIDPKTGNQVAAPGWDGAITNAITPAFAPSGKRIAFNHYDKDQGHTLSFMDFNVATKTFSGLTDIASDPAGYLAWPSFTPDGDWVIFHNTSRSDFATWHGSKADLYVAHIPSKTVARLDAVDGFANGATYLPYGEAADAHMNYEPTLLPVAAGGYYWVVFTSRRNYGNAIVTQSQNDTPRKKLWVAAIDVNVANGENPPHTSAYDASHPAFYLPGQEAASGNMRGFWALDPCKQNGNSCQGGDECCTGYCRQTNSGDGGTVLACVPPPSGCANDGEKCNVSADCCGAAQGYACINGFCAKPAPR